MFQSAEAYEWERQVLYELTKEYSHILRERRLALRPAVILLIDSTKYWGHWQSEMRTISLSRRLIQTQPWHHVLGVLRHEMAHQFVDEGLWDIKEVARRKKHDRASGDTRTGVSERARLHGADFQYACLRLGLPAVYASATSNLQSHDLDWREEKRDEAVERLLERVRKLLSLATSSNEHEALLAMNKVRELYAKHNLEQLATSSMGMINKNADASARTTPYTHLIVAPKKKRFEAHEQQIISLLVEHFFVKVIYIHQFDAPTAQTFRAFEIIGTRENVLMAEYVYCFLLQQVEYLLKQRLKSEKLSRFARKSFRLGVLKGFSDKLDEINQAIDTTASTSTSGLNISKSSSPTPAQTAAAAVTHKAEIHLVQKALEYFHNDKNLDDYIGNIFPRLVSTAGGRRYIDKDIYSQGKQAGRSITLNRAVETTSQKSPRLLGK